MAQVLRLILLLSYVLGLVSLGLGLVMRFIPLTGSLSARGALICAATLFLCSVASHVTAKTLAGQ